MCGLEPVPAGSGSRERLGRFVAGEGEAPGARKFGHGPAGMESEAVASTDGVGWRPNAGMDGSGSIRSPGPNPKSPYLRLCRGGESDADSRRRRLPALELLTWDSFLSDRFLKVEAVVEDIGAAAWDWPGFATRCGQTWPPSSGAGPCAAAAADSVVGRRKTEEGKPMSSVASENAIRVGRSDGRESGVSTDAAAAPACPSSGGEPFLWRCRRSRL